MEAADFAVGKPLEVITFDRFAAENLNWLVRLGYQQLGDRQRAEDAAQETLARLYQRWAHVSVMESPRGYARQILINECISWWRRAGKRRELALPDTDEGTGRFGSVPDGAEENAERSDMFQQLHRLKPSQRAVLVLRYYEDLSDPEIARCLSIRESTVRSHAANGIRQMRQNMRV